MWNVLEINGFTRGKRYDAVSSELRIPSLTPQPAHPQGAPPYLCERNITAKPYGSPCWTDGNAGNL